MSTFNNNEREEKKMSTFNSNEDEFGIRGGRGPSTDEQAEFPNDTAKEESTTRQHVPGVRVPAEVLEGILMVRCCGLTNMLDRPAVVRIARELDFPEAARWIETHTKEYAEGVFRGFEAEEGGER